MRFPVTAFFACGGALLVMGSCGRVDTGQCESFPPGVDLQGSDAWVPSTSDLHCCAPVHNQFVCSSDASLDGPSCAVTLGGFFTDDAGVGQSFPVGCFVNLTYCDTYFEGSPQTCICTPDGPDSGVAHWSCPI